MTTPCDYMNEYGKDFEVNICRPFSFRLFSNGLCSTEDETQKTEGDEII